MTRADSNASFTTAAKHLVRHLHDAAALRKNPFARSFFAEAGSARDDCLADREALAEIHRLFRAGAEHCRDQDVQAGKPERAQRQYAIAIEECLERRPTRSLAVELGLSFAQYYRDRAEICLRIGEYIRDKRERSSEAAVHRFDGFRFGIEHAARLAELGETQRAIDEYERLVHGADALAQKIEALCELALACLRRGASESILEHLKAAERLLAGSTGFSGGDRTVAEARVAFARGMFTWPSDPRSALELLHGALAKLERLPETWRNEVRMLYVRIRFEFGEALATFSNTRGSIETLAETAKMLARCEHASPILALKIDVTLLAMRMSMLMDPCGWEPVRRRLEKMQDLARRASSTGSVDLNLAALSAVSQLQSRSGDAPAALETVRSALTLSRERSSCEIFSEVSLRMARTVLYTPLWHEAPKILAAAGPPATVAVQASRKTLMAEYALRRGAYREIREAFSMDDLEKRPYDAVLAASAFHALGAKREARALLERAISSVEKGGVAVTIAQTYQIAARVTNERRYRQKAAEIRRSLTA